MLVVPDALTSGTTELTHLPNLQSDEQLDFSQNAI